MNGVVPITRDNPVDKFFRMWGRQYKIEFNIAVSYLPGTGWANVLHMTTGYNCCAQGNRIPGIWIENTKNFYFSTSINDNHNYDFRYGFQVGQYYHIEVAQVEDNIDNRKVQFSIKIDGVIVHQITSSDNHGPGKYPEVILYLSHPWSESFENLGELSNLTISNLDY